MKRLQSWILPAIPVTALLLAGCGHQQTSTSPVSSGGPSSVAAKPGNLDGKRFYWVQAPKGIPVSLLTQIAFRAGCEKMGYDCEVVGTDTPDTAGTMALAEAALAKGDAAGMGIWAGDASLNSLIAEAAQDGVPVIIPHFPTPQGSAPGLSGVISCDPTQYAADTAILMGTKLGGKGTIALTQAGLNKTENMVCDTFTKMMHAKFPGITVLPPDVEGLEPVQAVAKAVSILQAHPEVNAAFSSTGGGPQTWAGAEKETNHKILVVGVDYTRANLDLVKSGQVYALVAQPLWDESYQTAVLLDKLHHGQKIAYWTKLKAPIITKDNLDPYYKIMDQVDAAAKKG